MYIVRDFYSDEPEPPVRGVCKIFKTIESAYESAKAIARIYMYGRDEHVEGPFRFFTQDYSSIQSKGWSIVFESRDYYVWIERVFFE